uniref:Bifunctional heptose 7-phosphate kinase/heptose 1-phosphate adenyltransferase n=1 Tax=Thermorudis peleae TaxID=1382356 RepID=A0A831T7C9_9BACT
MTASIELVQRFHGLRALVLGDVMLDTYLAGTAERLCREAPVPIVRRSTEEHVPGGAANTAANLRALGAEVTLIGLIGPDHAGWRLREALQQRDIADAYLVEDAAVETLHKMRVLADGQFLVRIDEGDARRCSVAARQRLVEHLEQHLSTADVLVVSDYVYGVIDEELIDRLASLRHSRVLPLVVDSKQLLRFHRVPATVVTPNHLEACSAVDAPAVANGSHQPEALEEIGRCLLRRLETEHVAITLAGDGVLLLSREGSTHHVPAYQVAPASSIGAGDAFAAALALALAAGGDCLTATRIAVEAAGLAVRRRGTVVVEYQELLRRVSLSSNHHRPGHGVLDLPTLVSRLYTDRLAGRRIVLTCGVFDNLHAGHVDFLRRARALGDVLVVGINSDRSARRLAGQGGLLNHERDRLALVAALDPVDHAVLFDEDTPAALIESIHPDVYVKGAEHASSGLPESSAVREVGCELVYLPLGGSASSKERIHHATAPAIGNGRIEQRGEQA